MNVISRWYGGNKNITKKETSTVTIDELCGIFNCELNFDKKNKIKKKIKDNNLIINGQGVKNNVVDVVSDKNVQRLRKTINFLLIFLWLFSVCCVTIYTIQLLQNFNTVHYKEISLGIIFILSIVTVGIISIYQIFTC